MNTKAFLLAAISMFTAQSSSAIASSSGQYFEFFNDVDAGNPDRKIAVINDPGDWMNNAPLALVKKGSAYATQIDKSKATLLLIYDANTKSDVKLSIKNPGQDFNGSTISPKPISCWLIPAGRNKTQYLRYDGNVMPTQGFGTILQKFKKTKSGFSLADNIARSDIRRGTNCTELATVVQK